MIAEDLEFQISQYVDGTLSAAQRKSVDTLVQSSSEARQILSDYQRLNHQLVTLQSMPAIRFDLLADRISNHIVQAGPLAESPSIAGRIGFASSRWRVAAAVLIASTGLIFARHAMRFSHPSAVVQPSPTVDVTGPQAEVAKGPSVQDVTVGPSPGFASSNARYGEGVIGQGTPKVILGQLPKPTADPRLH